MFSGRAGRPNTIRVTKNLDRSVKKKPRERICGRINLDPMTAWKEEEESAENTRSSRKSKGDRRRQGWGLYRWTRSLRSLVLWRRLLLSFKSKRTGSNGYPHKGHSLPPRLYERVLRHVKRYRPEPSESRANRPSFQPQPKS